MHLNTLAGRGYSDLTQYPVFPWVLADYDSENLDLSDPKTFRKLDKPMGCQTLEGEDEFRKRYLSLPIFYVIFCEAKVQMIEPLVLPCMHSFVGFKCCPENYGLCDHVDNTDSTCLSLFIVEIQNR